MPSIYLAAPTPEHMKHIPVDPIWVGLGAFVVLLLLMVGVLMFGKGRPHA